MPCYLMNPKLLQCIYFEVNIVSFFTGVFSSKEAPLTAALVKPVSSSIETRPVVSVLDRTANQSALVLAFMAENNLSFTVAPKLIDLAKSLSRDTKALNKLSMDRTSASYKTRFGLALTMSDALAKELQSTNFSLNIDEATSDNLNRVLSILVSYYSHQHRQVVVRHLESLTVIKVDSMSEYEMY